MIGEIGAAMIDDAGTLEIGYAVVGSQRNRGYATAAVEAILAVKPATPRKWVASSPTHRWTAPRADASSRRRASRLRSRSA